MEIELNKDSLKGFYQNYFTYYVTLNERNKQRFIERCLHFMGSKAITGAEGFKVNNKVRSVVAACAVQLTMGLDTWDYDYFMEIIIHPKKFENKPTNQHFLGETNLQGYIKLSWLSFINGYKNSTDNINLGIHEFSHALRFNSIRGNEQDYYMKYFFMMWLSTAYEAHYHLKQGQKTIFREYGGTNINEFVSVCFEHYFESPQQIKEAYPHLFYNTAILLNQVTLDGITEINIREKMLLEKDQLLAPLKRREIKPKLLDANSVPLISVVSTILFFTMMIAGVFSGPTLILLGICFLIYLRRESQMVTLNINEKELQIKKGFLILKKWYVHSFSLSHLVNVHYTELENECELALIYYNAADDHFYEESVLCDKGFVAELLLELKANKIAINRM